MFIKFKKYILTILFLVFIPLNGYSQTCKVELKITWEKYIDKKIGDLNSNINLTIIKDTLFIASSKGIIFAIKDNKIIWKKNIKNKITFGPILNKKTLIVSSKANNIHAINPITGKTLFKTNLNENLLYTSKITNNNIYYNTCDNNIIGFNVKNKIKLFQYSSLIPSIDINTGINTLCSNGILYNIYSNGKLISINKNNNKIIWSKLIYNNNANTDYKKISTAINEIKINNKIIYTTNYTGLFSVIDTNNKNIIWTKNFNEQIKFLIQKKHILITTKNGKIYKLDKTNGNVIWTKNLNTKNLTKPLNIKKIKKILILDKYGYIYLLDKNKNIEKYKTKIGNIEKDPVKNLNENIYVLSKNGKLIYIKLYK